ncbi:MAG: hypothetical protein ACHBNF_02315 [Chromatiales bacterium]
MFRFTENLSLVILSARLRVLVLLSVLVAGLVLVTGGCATASARLYQWRAPQGFTAQQVFDASLRAGTSLGMQSSAADRQSGVLSFNGPRGVGQRSLSVTVRPDGAVIVVDAIGRYHAKHPFVVLATMEGSDDEDTVKAFHAALFRNLGVTDTTETNVTVKAAQ